MHLTRYTDYALRALLYLGQQQGELCSISEIAGAYAISQNHLMKVVSDLASAGYVESVRGRNGGIRLGKPADQINIGALVRHTEEDLALLDCGSCIIGKACGLPSVLDEALRAFLAVLDRYTLADVIARQGDFLKLLNPVAPKLDRH